MSQRPQADRSVHLLAACLGGLALVEVLAATVIARAVGWSWRDALDAFVISNALIGLSFATCGSIIAWYRSRNPIGWLFLVGGLAQATAAVAAPLGQLLVHVGAPVGLVRTVVTVFAWSWPLNIGLCLPLALLLFPDGRPASPRWRPVVIAVVVTAPLFSLEMGTSPGSTEPGSPPPYLTVGFYDALAPLWTATELRGLLAVALGLVALVLRYRRGTETARRQLLWLMLAVLVALAATIPWGLVAGTSIAVLFAIPLVPIAVTVAIVRHQLLDIRLVLSRALAWVLLSLAVLVAYVTLVALLDRVASARLGRSALVTVVLALVAAPLLPRLQRLVDRAVYGDRGNPARVVSKIGDQLAGADADLSGIVSTVRTALRLPYLALVQDDRVLSSAGEPPELLHRWPLTYGGRTVGELRLGLRAGERVLSSTDHTVLQVLTAPMAAAVQATAMWTELQASRQRIVAAQAEERRRLRRELHDGLGPTLTGIAFTADAAANLIDSDAQQATELLTALRRDTRTALADVRRIVDDLRPPSLDELGLVGALRQRAEQLSWRADGTAVRVSLDVPGQVPPLPAAVEVATYRIATEALTNVVRHSRATSASVRLHCDGRLEVSVSDDGPPDGAWTAGVGLQAMRDRAVELGGSFRAGPSPQGGRVVASFPLESAPVRSSGG
jgi:two-component system NarL family sensor kinase